MQVTRGTYSRTLHCTYTTDEGNLLSQQEIGDFYYCYTDWMNYSKIVQQMQKNVKIKGWRQFLTFFRKITALP